MQNKTRSEKFWLHLDMGENLDLDQIDTLTRQLKNEILEQGIDAVEIVTEDEVPPGIKSAEAVTWGVLAVSVLPNVLPKLIEFLQSWTMRGESRKIKVRSQIGEQSIELEYSPTNISNKELKELISVLSKSMQANTAKQKEDSTDQQGKQ